MYYLIQSILFISSKWDMSLDEFNLLGKILFYIPLFINNILVQIWYIIFSPLVYLKFILEDKINEFISL